LNTDARQINAHVTNREIFECMFRQETDNTTNTCDINAGNRSGFRRQTKKEAVYLPLLWLYPACQPA